MGAEAIRVYPDEMPWHGITSGSSLIAKIKMIISDRNMGEI